MRLRLPAHALRLLVLVDLLPGVAIPHERVRGAIRGGATMIQLRGKRIGSRALWKAALGLSDLCRERSVPLFVNDRPDVARAARADGVHVGPDDLPPSLARDVIGPLALGVSARSPDRVRMAEVAGADYLGVGALRATQSKTEARVIGLEGIASLAATSAVPVVAIGGVCPEDAVALRQAGAAGMAILSGIMDQDDPEEAARLYASSWDRA